MTTREMLRFMKEQGYHLTLFAAQCGIEYFRLFRHTRGGSELHDDEKARLWQFALCQPCLDSELRARAAKDAEE